MPAPADALAALRALAMRCAGVRAGERCLIVTDTDADEGIVAALAAVLDELGATVGTVSSEPVDLPGDAPPDAVGRAILEAEVVFELTSVFAGSSRARREACAAGARYLTVPGLTWTTLRPDGPFSVDFAALGAVARRIAERIDAAREFRLRGPGGTDLRGSFAGRRGRPLWGVADRPGGYAAPPDVEVGASPVEGTAEGVVVVDGSILFLGPDQLASPVELRVSAGRLVDASGPEAWRLLDALERSGDPERMTNVAEVSIGLNPRSRPGGSALELEGIVGGAHVALGNNVAYGGTVDARAHIDCVILSATLALDGRPVTLEELPSISTG
jgi:leucyl aminopeptidase (aminopeptidase T)